MMSKLAERLDANHFMHPWEAMDALGTGGRTVARRASGIHVVEQDGRARIDGAGGMWCVQVGYGRQEIAEAMAYQAEEMNYFSPFSSTSVVSARLAAVIAQRAPGDLNRVFFTTGGSTAVDTALRFIQFRNNILGKPHKKIVISREKAYHGSTYLAASVSGTDHDREWFDHADGLVHFLPDVNPYRRPEGMSIEDFLDAKVADLEKAILGLGADRVAAFIAEPVLASGGVIVPPEGYHRRCLEVCRKHDVLYISDEVVTGFGRLGHWFASEPVFDIVPDIITCAKGLTSGYAPLGACIIAERLLADVSGKASQGAVFSSGFTYSGHPVASAAALKNIEIIEREGVLEHVRTLTPHFQERLAALRDLPLVADTRGMGLMGCVECSVDAGTRKPQVPDMTVGEMVNAHCREQGLILQPLKNMCAFSPPLIIERSQVDQMFDILEKGMRLTIDDLARKGCLAG